VADWRGRGRLRPAQELELERRAHDLLKVEHYKLLRAYDAVLAKRAEVEREIARLSATRSSRPLKRAKTHSSERSNAGGECARRFSAAASAFVPPP
jgi:hypothetical protein